MGNTSATANPPASGRSSVLRLMDVRRITTTTTTSRNATEVSRARDARRKLGRQERFAHLKRMYD